MSDKEITWKKLHSCLNKYHKLMGDERWPLDDRDYSIEDFLVYAQNPEKWTAERMWLSDPQKRPPLTTIEKRPPQTN